jgi:Tannase and feruloyl esterase
MKFNPRSCTRWLPLLLAISPLADAADKPEAYLRPKQACETLKEVRIAAADIRLPTGGAHVTSAKLIAAQGEKGTPNYLPEYCEVFGVIEPHDPKAGVINFGVAIPTEWNGNAMQIGGNGMLGFVPWLAALNRDGAGSPAGPAYPPNAAYPLALGYATYGDDSGHKVGTGTAPGAPGGVVATQGQATMGGAPPAMDFSWVSNRETWLNFTYQNIRKDHDASFGIIRTLYGRSPKETYFTGESHGGRQAMEAVARYPEDYDGVFVSVPLAYLTEMWVSGLRNLKAEALPGGWIPPEKKTLIEAETVRQCDALDGRQDGVIMNYAACDKVFDPAIHPDAMQALRCVDGSDLGPHCLSDAQIRTVNTFRSAVTLGYEIPGKFHSYPGIPAGSESTHPWVSARQQPDAANLMFPFMDLLGRYFEEPGLTVDGFDANRLAPKLQRLSEELDPPTDWSKFFAKGGKVIFATGSNDYITNSHGHILAYQAVMAQSGAAAAKDMRFYMTPGGDHGSRSFSYPDKTPQARHMNLISVLTNWVEHGTAPPEQVPQALMAKESPYAVTRARPLCQYPQYPKYEGTGDAALAASYHCAKP